MHKFHPWNICWFVNWKRTYPSLHSCSWSLTHGKFNFKAFVKMISIYHTLANYNIKNKWKKGNIFKLTVLFAFTVKPHLCISIISGKKIRSPKNLLRDFKKFVQMLRICSDIYKLLKNANQSVKIIKNQMECGPRFRIPPHLLSWYYSLAIVRNLLDIYQCHRSPAVVMLWKFSKHVTEGTQRCIIIFHTHR